MKIKLTLEFIENGKVEVRDFVTSERTLDDRLDAVREMIGTQITILNYSEQYI